MAKKDTFVVIGLGRFGMSLAKSLVERGAEVLAVDRRIEVVQEVSEELTSVSADATDEAALRELGVEGFTCAVVAIGANSTEASILATALLQKLGVPRIIARANSDLQGRVLAAVGAHEVLNPEAEMGRAVGRRLSIPNLVEHLELGDGTVLAEIQVPEGHAGKAIAELELEERFGLAFVALRRQTKILPRGSQGGALQAGDVVIVLGAPDKVETLAGTF